MRQEPELLSQEQLRSVDRVVSAMCVCVCMCVCVKHNEQSKVSVCVCVCARVSLCVGVRVGCMGWMYVCP